MDLSFERGDAQRPRGHTLVYFRTRGGAAAFLATYIVVPPVALDLARYVPPMLAGSLPLSELGGMQAIPVPPIPEAVESLEWLRALAVRREDDLIDGGTVDAGDMQRMLAEVGEIAAQYAERYQQSLSLEPPAAALGEPAYGDREGVASVDEVLYGLMSERQRLNELTKLIGKLRYAIDGQDSGQMRETVREIETLGQHLSDKYRVADLLAAARRADPAGARLSQLYLERGYKLADESYEDVARLDAEIRQVETETS